LIHTFPAEPDGNRYEVNGLALLNNELYVLCREDEQQVDIHSTTDFALLRQITVEGTDGVQDIAACAQKQCIYLFDFDIHRLGLDGSVTKWSVDMQIMTARVTPSSDLIVICYEEDDEGYFSYVPYVISSETGDCLRRFLPQLLENKFLLEDCMQLSDDCYVVCYPSANGGRLCRVDGQGRIVRSSRDDVRMKLPTRIAMDGDNFTFVADQKKCCVLLFDPVLDFVCNVTEGLDVCPRRMVYDEVTRRLYMDQDSANVIVVQL